MGTLHIHLYAKTRDSSVASVEKEIANQQRLIDAVKAQGKEPSGQLISRMKFLHEELEKARFGGLDG